MRFLLHGLVLLVFIFGGCQSGSLDSEQPVNAVIGDVSFTSKFGFAPDAATDENLRIGTHLEYVERKLTERDVSDLSTSMQQKRLYLLDLLKQYRTAGIFPRNYDHADKRRPCFIDRDGRICAVGYLIEQTAGRAVADEINRRYKYEEVLAMNDPAIDKWVRNSGLTKEECAMIQPTYGYVPVTRSISTEYGIASALLGGLNLSLSAVNGIQIANGRYKDAAPVMGIFAGGLQIALGAATIADRNDGTMNDAKKTVSMINIAVGTVSLALSTANLTQPKRKDVKTTWGVFSYPTAEGSLGVGLSVTRKL